jgi:hypothetical protein
MGRRELSNMSELIRENLHRHTEMSVEQFVLEMRATVAQLENELDLLEPPNEIPFEHWNDVDIAEDDPKDIGKFLRLTEEVNHFNNICYLLEGISGRINSEKVRHMLCDYGDLGVEVSDMEVKLKILEREILENVTEGDQSEMIKLRKTLRETRGDFLQLGEEILEEILSNLFNVPVAEYLSALKSQITVLMKEIERMENISFDDLEKLPVGFTTEEYIDTLTGHIQRSISLHARLEVLQEATNQVLDRETNNLVRHLGDLEIIRGLIKNFDSPLRSRGDNTIDKVRNHVENIKKQILQNLNIMHN